MTYHHLSVLIHRQAEKYGDKVAPVSYTHLRAHET